MLSRGSVVVAKETIMIWSAEVDGDEGVMMSNVNCIHACQKKTDV